MGWDWNLWSLLSIDLWSGGRSEPSKGPVPWWVALTVYSFMMSIGWVFFRGANSDIENKSRYRASAGGR